MGYSSPKTLRRRQSQIEEKIFRPKAPRTKRSIPVPTEAEFEFVIDRHVEKVHRYIEEGNVELAGWYAKQAVNYRRTARAMAICRDFNRAWWKACLIARHELYTV